MRHRTTALLLGITSVALRFAQLPEMADILGLAYLFVVTVGIGRFPGLLDEERTRLNPAFVTER